MSYISLEYYVFIIILVFLYYGFPKKNRWYVLLVGSICFYIYLISNISQVVVFMGSIIASYISAVLIDYLTDKYIQRFVLWLGILVSAVPLFLLKGSEFVCNINKDSNGWIVPIGLSFYTLQVVAYLVDVYHKKIILQKNILKYTLFISFFPQIIQGPISRYEQLGNQLFEEHDFKYDNISKGTQLIIWGFFLKMMIADKAAIVVNTVFDNYSMYAGGYILVAGILYSIQLYADFLGCVKMSQGAALLFDIQIIDNFKQPYFSASIKEFWRRWHISLSSWLKDYIYIPLGGSRGKRKLKKYVNLIITFLVSGLWHGEGWKFILWGGLHAAYQIIGEMTLEVRNRIYTLLEISKDSFAWRLYKTIGTFFWVMLAWIIFRADNLTVGLKMIKSMFFTFNPWIFFDNSLYNLGLDFKEWELLILSIVLLIVVGVLQQKYSIRELIEKQHISIRWGIYIGVILVIWVYGTYGFGFNAQDFIYGGF